MKPKILIVEDDVIISESIAADLINENYQVVAQCESGEIALKEINDKLPDLIIMDIKLKGDLNGVETAERISKQFNIPIIFLTDLTDDKTFQKAKVTSPANYLTKPFQSHQLLMAIELSLFKSTSVENSDFGFFKTPQKEAVKVHYKDILYLKADKVYCHVVLKNKRHTISQPMKSVLQRIPYKDLIRISKTHCVNKNQVDKIIGNMLYIGEEKITIGEKYRHVARTVFNII